MLQQKMLIYQFPGDDKQIKTAVRRLLGGDPVGIESKVQCTVPSTNGKHHSRVFPCCLYCHSYFAFFTATFDWSFLVLKINTICHKHCIPPLREEVCQCLQHLICTFYITSETPCSRDPVRLNGIVFFFSL